MNVELSNRLDDMKKIIAILIVLTCSNFVRATEQMPDYLHYNQKKLTLHTGWGHPSPLQTYYYQNDLNYPFSFWSTANYRGHVATWEIVDDKLYLKEIKIRDNLFAPKEYDVKSKNANFDRDNSVFADWFSGMIACQESENSYYFYVRYGEVQNIQTLSKKDYKKISKMSVKDTANHALMSKYSMLVLNDNYVSYYFRLNEKDNIAINGQIGHFKNKIGYSPLLEFYSNDHMQFPYNWENFEKNGAPNCKWSVVNNKVFLNEVQLHSGTGFFEIRKDSIELKDLFSEGIEDNKISADWLNGVYVIEYGTEKDGVFPAFKEFTLTEYAYLRIKDGVIQELYTVPSDFNFKNIPEETDPALKQLLNEFK